MNTNRNIDAEENGDFYLWVLIAQTREVLSDLRQKELRPRGILTKQAGVLLCIHNMTSKATPAEIARWMGRDPVSVLGMLNRMTQDGLVKRVKDLDRRNQVRIVLTEKGQQVLDFIMKRESIHKVMSSISKEERKQLATMLETLRDTALKELGDDYELYYKYYSDYYYSNYRK